MPDANTGVIISRHIVKVGNPDHMRNSCPKSNALIHRLKSTFSRNGKPPYCAVSNNRIDMLGEITTDDILQTIGSDQSQIWHISQSLLLKIYHFAHKCRCGIGINSDVMQPMMAGMLFDCVVQFFLSMSRDYTYS